MLSWLRIRNPWPFTLETPMRPPRVTPRWETLCGLLLFATRATERVGLGFCSRGRRKWERAWNENVTNEGKTQIFSLYTQPVKPAQPNRTGMNPCQTARFILILSLFVSFFYFQVLVFFVWALPPHTIIEPIAPPDSFYLLNSIVFLFYY